jgi:hypothetical protein
LSCLWLAGLARQFLAKLVGVGRVLVSLHRELMSSEMIAFAVGCCGGLVGVGSKIVELCDPIVGALGHDVLLVLR